MRNGAARLAALVLAAALTAAVGCGGGGGGGTQAGSRLPPAGGGGTLAYALPGLPSTLDPLAAHGRTAQTVTRQIYEPLIERLAGPYGQTAAQPGLSFNARPSAHRTTWAVNPPLGVRLP